MKIKRTLPLVILLLITNFVFSQLALEKANTHYARMEYKDAADLYEKVLKKNAQESLAIHHLANCYFKLNNMPQAEKWYAKAVQLPDAKPEEYLNYAEVLEENKNYDEAKKWFEKYSAVTGQDKRGKRYTESLSHLSEYYADSANYKVTLVKELSSGGSDFSPHYYKNGLVYVSERDHDKFSNSEFMWDQSHFLDLYFAEFDKEELPSFKKEHPFNAKVNSKYHEGPVAMNKDQTFMVFTRNNYFNKKTKLSTDGVNKLKLFFDEYKNGKWLSAQNFPYNDDNYSCGHPALTADGKTMYFVSDMPGGFGGTDIWKSVYENGSWSKPENIGDKLNSEGNEMFPTLVNDSVFYFASNGLGGLGGLDIYSSSYSKGLFGDYKNLGYPINSSYDDFGLIYNSKSQSGYFTSNRKGTLGGSDDIYHFKSQGNYLTLLVIDAKSNVVLPKGTLTYTQAGRPITINTDENGKAKIKLLPETEYKFISTYDNYIEANGSISSAGSNANKNLELTIPMEMLQYQLLVTVIDNADQKVIPEVSIKLVDESNNKLALVDEKSSPEGTVSKPLINKGKGDTLKFEIGLTKEKYLPKTERVNLVIGNEKLVKIKLGMDKVQVGTEVGTLMDIKPIYFDVDEAVIRSDAQIELDKIVKLMKENFKIVIELGSHTDCRASENYNKILSDKRAKASVSYIVSKGIDKKRIYGKGFGESKLLNACDCEGDKVSNCSDDEHQLNRRTEFKIVKM